MSAPSALDCTRLRNTRRLDEGKRCTIAEPRADAAAAQLVLVAVGVVLGVVAAGVDGVGVGVGVLDGDGAGPFASASAIAFTTSASVLLTCLPFTNTVGVELTPRRLEASVIAATSALCCSVWMHVVNVVI